MSAVQQSRTINVNKGSLLTNKSGLFLEAFHADADVLVRRLSSLITDQQLSTIAAADYGIDHIKHLVELQQIRTAGRVSTLSGWRPREVLELIGHSQPDDPFWKPGETGINGWMMKAFCTAVLANVAVRNKCDNLPYHLGGLLQSILQLQVLSACDLRVEFTKFAAWATSQELTVENDPFEGIALLTGALTLRPAIDDTTVVAICEWISAAESRLAAESDLGGDHWLVGHSSSLEAAETWSPIGLYLCELPLEERGEGARNCVRTLGTLLAG